MSLYDDPKTPYRFRCSLCNELGTKANPTQGYRTADGVPFRAHDECERGRAGLGDQPSAVVVTGGAM